MLDGNGRAPQNEGNGARPEKSLPHMSATQTRPRGYHVCVYGFLSQRGIPSAAACEGLPRQESAPATTVGALPCLSRPMPRYRETHSLPPVDAWLPWSPPRVDEFAGRVRLVVDGQG